LVYGDEEGGVTIKDLRNEEIVGTYNLPEQKVTQVSFLNNTQVLISGENTIRLIETGGGELTKINSNLYNGNIVDLK